MNSLIESLEKKKRDLVSYINEEIDRKLAVIHQQYSSYNEHIQRTTGFLQFSIEALKQSDPSAYLSVRFPWMNRLTVNASFLCLGLPWTESEVFHPAGKLLSRLRMQSAHVARI